MGESVQLLLTQRAYLNGGLFHRNDLDDLPFNISDSLFGEAFNFLEQYNFTIREEIPLDVEVAVDPQMIGYVYESLSNVAEEIYERQDLGIFYTPAIEVDFMCRRSLVEYIANYVGAIHELPLPKEWIYRLLFDEDKKAVEEYITKHKLWYRLEEALDNLAVIDPACGSGAFLVGMLHVLIELFKLIYSHIQRQMTEFEIKKRIIGNTLYGVDVMPWAVHSAELRLWLQLIIDADIPPEQRKLHPLLPNLDLKLRVGDSLVQKVEGLSLRVKDMKISDSLKRKLSSLKTEKEKYYDNNPTAKFKDPKSLLQEELRIFTEILDDRVVTFQKEIQTLEVNKRKRQIKLFKEDEKEEPEQKALFEEQIKVLKQKIEDIEAVRRKLREPGHKPFVWDIDFAEIFGDKGGFDIVIGNPPYVRQEKIAPPNKLKAEVTLEDRQEYKEKLFNSVQAHFPCIQKMDKKSDYYIYFYFHGLALLNEKGTFCFITSNSWLDVGYGKDLQEFLLKYCHIKAIYDNQTKRSFEHADVNTIVALFGAPNVGAIHELPLQNTAKFVMFKRPFEEVINTRNLLEIEKAREVAKTDAYRVFPVKQETLLEEGWEYPEDVYAIHEIPKDAKTIQALPKSVGAVHELPLQKPKQKSLIKDKFLTGKYEGNKWGGKYLRAPDIFFTILEKGKGKLVRLGDIAEVRRGFTTGCNEFFYLDKDGIEKWGIEEEFLKPVIKSPRECKSILVKPEDLKYKVFMCHREKKELKGTHALKYIEWGERQGFHKGPSCSGRQRWWELSDLEGNMFWVKETNDRLGVFLSNNHMLCDCRLYYTKGNSQLQNSVNATLFGFISEILSRGGLGEGAKSLMVYEVNNLLTLNPASLKVNPLILGKRDLKSIFEELGISPNIPIREQKPNPLPDRKALDDIVFDILGLTPDERNEVYWAVCELVKNRLDKARSL